MKIKNLIEIKGVFAPIVRMKLSPKFSYKLLKFLKAIEFEETFFNGKMREIIDEYGQKDEKGEFIVENGNIKIVLGKEDDCAAALKELHELDVTPPEIVFTLDELQEITLSVQDMALIEDFIKEDDNA